MKVLICGSRDWKDVKAIERVMAGLMLEGYDHLIHGGCRGADRIASGVAMVSGYMTQSVFYADWDKHGRAAGPIRNQQMLDEGKPDLVVAFLLPQGSGTLDMIRRTEKAGIEVRVIEP